MLFFSALRKRLRSSRLKKVQGCLDSVEVVEGRVPVNRECFLAFGVSANKVLFNDITVKTASQRLFKGIRGVNFIWGRSFKNPVTVRAFEGQFSFSHKSTLTSYYGASKLKIL
jgi:hypothetical protein